MNDARQCIYHVAHLMDTELDAHDEGMLGILKDLAELIGQLSVRK